MKRILLSIVLSICAFGALAQYAGGKEIVRVATQFDQQGIYCYNVKDGGFLITTSRADLPVIGYSTTGSLNPEKLPDALKAWLQDMGVGIVSGTQVAEKRDPKNLAREVEPLLTSAWSQTGYGYNDYTPADEDLSWIGGHPTVGCGALALGQVLRYWGYPQHGMGSTTYSYEGKYPCWTYDTLTVNYEDHHYDYANMPDQLSSYSTDAQREAVGVLLYDCGVSLKMLYNVDCNGSSGAFEMSQVTALKEVFGYNSDAHVVWRRDYELEDWSQLMKKEIAEGRPILFCGYCADPDGNPSSGHAFVLDGYDADGLFHVNWGWGGSCDGYYAIATLEANGMMSFAVSQSATIGVDTNRGHSPVVRLASNLSIDGPHVPINGHIHGGYQLTNSGDSLFDGYVGFAIYDTLNDDDSYHQFYRYFDTRHIQLAVGDTLDVRVDCFEALDAGRYHICLHYGDRDFSADSSQLGSLRLFDACHDFEYRLLVDEATQVGISEMEEEGLLLYPNPAHDVVMVESDGEIQVVDMMGKVVLTAISDGFGKQLDIRSLQAGIYMVKSGTRMGRLIKR